MRYAGRIAGLGLAALLLTGCGRGRGGVWDDLVAPQELARASLQYYWRIPVELEKRERIIRLWRLDENLYALTSQHNLLAIDAARGLYKWSVKVAPPGQTVFPPCHADEVRIPKASGIKVLMNPPDLREMEPFNAVIINTLSRALVIDRDSGKVMRALNLSFAANTGGSSDGVNVYIGSVQGRFYAVRLSEGINQWTLATQNLITAAPKLFGRRLYVASQDGRLYAVDPARDKDRHLWKVETDAALTADFVVDERGCFVPSQDYKLYAVEGFTGTGLWTFTAQGSLRRPVQVGERTVFQYAEGDTFYAIDLATGKQRWTMDKGRVVLAALSPHVAVLTADRKIELVHESLGKTERILPTTGLDLFVPNADKPVIYAATGDGRFVCIRPIDAGHLKPEDLRPEVK